MSAPGIHSPKKVKYFRSLLHSIAEYMLFAVIMVTVFYLTFDTPGKWLSDILLSQLSVLSQFLDSVLLKYNTNPAFRDLVVNGICPGVGSVLSFIPVIAVLFTLLGILQESGYLDNVAVIMDRPFRIIRLSGQCAIPLITGFGCSVPAIMSIAPFGHNATASTCCHAACFSKSEITTVIRLIPFMSCSARLPVYAMIISCFFPEHRISSLLGIYGAGIAAALIFAIISGFCHKQDFIHVQKPRHTIRYHIPDVRGVLSLAAVNVMSFIRKAFTVIFTASVLVWYLQSYGIDMHPVSDSSDSILAFLGKTVSPVLEPIGFGDWRAASALIAGLAAKEAIISTFVVTSSSYSSFFNMLTDIFTPLSAFSFMIFCLLYMPCIATLCSVRNASGSWAESALMAAAHIIIAWCASFAVYNVGTLITGLL